MHSSLWLDECNMFICQKPFMSIWKIALKSDLCVNGKCDGRNNPTSKDH